MSDARPPLLLQFGDYQLDEADARLSRAGRAIELQPKAFAVLCELARRPGQLVTKDTLLDAVWGHRHVSESVLKTLISHLRSALADDARQPRYIETAARRGYRFIGVAAAAPAPVVASPEPPPVPDLIGRAEPARRLQAAFAAASAGKRRIVFVAGEAGIGKSTLIDRFSTALQGRAAVALGQCVEHYGPGEPYMPLLEALNELGRGEQGASLRGLMRRVAPTWLVQLPWMLDDEDRQRLPREVAGATQDRMLRELGELLDRVAAERPLVLVLEDLHWSDHATVQAIGYLARRRSPAALLLVGSFRATEIIVAEHPLAGLRQELRLHGLCEELDVETFSEAEVGALLAARLGGDAVPEAFVRAVQRHTEGLPLFVVALVDELVAAGRLQRSATGWHFPAGDALGVPQRIAGVVEKQIARLPAERQRLLEAAAVAGVDFPHLLPAAALQQPAAAVRDALDAAAAADHWVRSDRAETLADGRLVARYAFRHAVYRHVFYARIAPAQRMGWHRAMAAALGELHGSDAAGEIAMHHELGGDFEAAIRQYAAAAGRAVGRGAPRDAVRAVRRGEALLDRVAPAAEAALELELRAIEGVALARLHVISEPPVALVFERAVALCAQVPPGPAQVRALVGLWWVRYARCELPEARALAGRLAALAEAVGQPALRIAALNTAGLTHALTGEFAAARAALEASLALHAQLADAAPRPDLVQDPVVEARGYLALLLWWMDEPDAARRHAALAIERAAALNHPLSQLIALQLAAAMHHFAGEPAAALARLDELLAVVRRHDLPAAPGSFAWLRGHMVATLGRFDEGVAEQQQAAESCRRIGLLVGLSGHHMHLGETWLEAGRFAAAAQEADAGLAWAQAREERHLVAPLRLLQARARAGLGDAAGATASRQAAIEVATAQGAAFHLRAARVLRLG